MKLQSSNKEKYKSNIEEDEKKNHLDIASKWCNVQIRHLVVVQIYLTMAHSWAYVLRACTSLVCVFFFFFLSCVFYSRSNSSINRNTLRVEITQCTSAAIWLCHNRSGECQLNNKPLIHTQNIICTKQEQQQQQKAEGEPKRTKHSALTTRIIFS